MIEYEIALERATQRGVADAQNDAVVGRDRTGEDVIADTEELVFSLTGKKLFELEDDDDDFVVKLVEAYDEAYIETYMSEGATT